MNRENTPYYFKHNDNWNTYDIQQYDALITYLQWRIGRIGWTIGL